MRTYLKDRSPDIREGLLGLLVAAFDAEQGDVWLVSPWLRDVEIPISSRGHFASVFGGHRDHVLLSDVVGALAARHRVRVLIKPPDELVSIRDVQRLLAVREAADQMQAEEEIRGYDAVDQALRRLEAEAETLAEDAGKEFKTLQVAWKMRERGAELLFVERLHAKLLWTPVGALLGSANFTNAGLLHNEELVVELSSGAEHRQLREAAAALEARATSWAGYDLSPALRRARVDPEAFRQWPARVPASDRSPLGEMLRWLAPLARSR